MRFENLIDRHHNCKFLILCGGSTVLKYKEQITKISQGMITIGVANCFHIMRTKYNLWTNNRRFKEYGENIPDNTIPLFGSHLKKGNITTIFPNKRYITVPYTDIEGEKFGYDGNNITGFYRTSGNLAIMLAHIMGARKIFVAGMDGHSFLFNGNQHHYGSGLTDNQPLDYCKEYDNIISNRLDALKGYGIKFHIITPTVFEQHYRKGVLI